jgi:hypothetical protein
MFHITQAKQKLKDRLVADLPGRLAQADAEAGDGVVTPPPYEIHTTDKADLGGLPSLELIVTDSNPQANSYAQIYKHRLVIGVSVGGDIEEHISTQIERYVWCLRAIVRDLALTPIEGTAALDTGGEQYTPLFQRPETVEHPFVKGCFLEVFVTTVE